MRRNEEYVLNICRECGVDTELFIPGCCKKVNNTPIFQMSSERKKEQLVKARYAVKYVIDDDVFIVWEVWEGRKNCSIQGVDYNKARNSRDCYVVKSLNYSGRINERIYVLSPDKFRLFIMKL